MKTKAEKAAYQRAWRRKNPASRQASLAKYKAAHPNANNEASRRRYIKDPEKVNLRNLVWLSKNKERHLEYQREFYVANPDKWKEYRQRHYIKYRGKHIERARRRHGIIMQADNLSPAHRAEIQGFYDFCKIFKGFEVDHIVPLVHKQVCGLHVPVNLQILTTAMNRSKGNRWTQEQDHVS